MDRFPGVKPMTRPRILHVIHTSAFGGGPNMLAIICARLRDEFEMEVVSDGQGDLVVRLESMGLTFHTVPLTNKWSFARHIPRLAALIRLRAPDLVHLHGQFAGSLGQISVQLAGRPQSLYTAQWPAYLDDDGPWSKLRNHVAERVSCRLSTAVVAVSQHDRLELIRRRLCDPEKITLIHNAFAPEFLRASHRPEERESVIRFFGRLAPQKGVDVLLEALAIVLPERPDWFAEIVGDGPERTRLERLAASLGAEGRVRFTGYVPDPGPLMRRTSITAIPSRFEPFGIVATEAMASGSTVVASRIGGLPEIIRDLETGLLFKPGIVSELVACLELLIQNNELRDRLAAAGRASVVTKFSAGAMANSYRSLYKRLVDNRNVH